MNRGRPDGQKLVGFCQVFVRLPVQFIHSYGCSPWDQENQTEQGDSIAGW